MTETPPHPGANTRLFTVAFCPNCQFSLEPVSMSPVCPGCGHSVSTLASVSNKTILFRDPAGEAPAATEEPKATQATEVDELIGRRLGVYDCEGLLGAGAMGRVYLARHRDLQRKCALKMWPGF